jgi:hypothetical protein
MATFGDSNFVERLVVNIPEVLTPITNANVYTVPTGFKATLIQIEYEGRGFNAGNGPVVFFNFAPFSNFYGGYFTYTDFGNFSTGSFSLVESSFSGLTQIRTYVDGSGFRRASAVARIGINFSENDRIGYRNTQSFFAFRARLIFNVSRLP